MLKIGYLGAGSWGFCLASLLAGKKYQVTSWTTNASLAKQLNATREHPFLPGHRSEGPLHFTTDLEETLDDADFIVESVTSAGLRPVFEKIKLIKKKITCPIVITSKGIEQNSGLILPDVAVQVLGDEVRPFIGVLTGPSFAEEVIKGLPTSVVGSGFTHEVMMDICETFTTETFRVYPNTDIYGVAFGGALKNIIAIACGISDGLGLGFSSKAALMTRGLHEIRKLALARGYRAETIYGLSGMGDLCLTCSSMISRNYRFGHLLAQGLSPKQAEEKIQMVVEGAYTCVSTLQLSLELEVIMPIAEIIYKIIYQGMMPKDAVSSLMMRPIKEEHL